MNPPQSSREEEKIQKAMLKTGPYVPRSQRGGSLTFFDKRWIDDLWVRLGIIFLAFLIFMPGLGSFGLWDPWEVHYGEVGRQMLERGDWISPWWGSHWSAPGEGQEGEYFFSKPVLLLWMMGIGLQLFGFTEFGIRFGVALIAIMGVVSVYMMGLKVFSKRVGVLMALTLMTSPFYTMLGRQAQTDMPFVGMMTVGLSFFMMGVFGKDRSERMDKVSFGVFTAFILALTIPQLHTVLVGQLNPNVPPEIHWAEKLTLSGWVQAGFYVVLMGAFFLSVFLDRKRTRGQLYLYTFYAFVGLATMGKGILGFALPGAIIFLYLVVSRDWHLLIRAEILRGILVAIFVGFPWYGAMFARHGGIGGAFWNRFIVHDHFKRLATGVHQIDNGSFEHFIKWLGYGVFPWGAFVPAFIARAFNGEGMGEKTTQDRARTFLFIWFAVAFSLFTYSSTKFHHYIFPCVPAIALLASLVIDDLLSGKISFARWWPLYLGGGAILVLVGFDLVSDPQHLKNMFTYKYDRRWDHETWDAGLKSALRLFFVVSIVGYLFLAAVKRRRALQTGLVILYLNALAFGVWALNVYMPTISPTWSQAELWATYYELCTEVEPPRGVHEIKSSYYCMESVTSYKLNWRGETYYTQNEVIPIRNDNEWDFFIEQNDGRCFFTIMEHTRLGSFRSAMPAGQRDDIVAVHEDNIKFVLAAVNCRDLLIERGFLEADEDEQDAPEASATED